MITAGLWTALKPAHRRAGLSMVELMAAASIMLIGVLSLLSGMVYGAGHLLQHQRHGLAEDIVHRKLEEIHAADWQQMLALHQDAALDTAEDGLVGGLLTVHFGSEQQAASFLAEAIDLDNDGLANESEPAHAGMAVLYVEINVAWSEKPGLRNAHARALVAERGAP